MDATVSLRLATLDDLSLVTALRLRFVAEVRGDPSIVDDQPYAETTAGWLAAGHRDGTLRTWLAEGTGGAVVGLATLVLRATPPQPADPRCVAGYVINVWVEPTCRGRGIARALMDQVLAEAPTLGVKEVELVATDAGRPLYESLGFAPEPTALRLRLPPPSGTGL